MTIPVKASKLRHPTLELLARYRAILAASWEARYELAGPARMADEAAFLPAALSMQETPAHPAPRRLGWAICGLLAAALAWSIVGEVDVVSVAAGRIVVSERTKTLQPLEASVVKRVLVKDGDAVEAGQVLVELDATIARADHANVQEQLSATVSEETRASALLTALDESRAPPSAEHKASQRNDLQLHAEWQDITARLAKLKSELAHRQAEIVTVEASIDKLATTLPMAQQREADFKGLAEQGFMSGHAGQDRTRERVELERDLTMQRARLVEAHAALAESQSARIAYLAETRRALSDRQALAASKREQLMQDRSKTEQRTQLARLTAPVAGTVQQLAIHTDGGVVTPAQTLLVIVPKDAPVTAEVVIDNKDIGFVNAGQAAAVKLETFPFTRYGIVPATVQSVTADAVNDDKKGAIFLAVLTLNQATIDVDGKHIRLSPGMNVSAEVMTGKRRLIEYLLSPIQKTMSESMKER